MRLWSLHPKYLDRQGLIALWREGLLAQAVLKGKTKGYKNHPQLNRFKTHPKPLQAIAYYLHEVRNEAKVRGYKFDATKYDLSGTPQPIPVTAGQLAFEVNHLKNKLKVRSENDFIKFAKLEVIESHPLFQITPGDVEEWEKQTP